MRAQIFLVVAVCIAGLSAVDLDAASLCKEGGLVAKIRALVPQWMSFCETMDANGLQITFVNNVLTLKVAEKSSSSLTDLLPDTGVKFLDGEERIDISEMVFNFNEPWQLSVKTRPYPSLEIIAERLSMAQVKVDVIVGKSSRGRVTLKNLFASGDWQLGSVIVSTSLKKDGSKYLIKGSPKGGKVDISAVATALGERLLPAGSSEAALKRAGFDKVSISGVEVTGFYDSATDDVAFCFTGSPSIAGWGGYRLHALFHSYAGGKKTVATMAVTFPSVRLSTLIKKVSGLDISSVPILGGVTVQNTGFLISTSDVEPNLLPECMDGILKDTEPFPEGVSIVSEVKILADVEPAKCLIRIDPSMGVTMERIDDSRIFTLPNIMRALNLDFNNLPLINSLRGRRSARSIIEQLKNADVSGVNFDVKKFQLTLTVDWGDKLEILPNFLSINNPSMNVNVTLKSPRNLKVDFQGQWAIGSASFEVGIFPQEDNKGYVLKGSGKELKIGELLAKVLKSGASFFPGGINIPSFLRDFKIMDPSVQIPIGEVAKTLELRLSGQPQIADFGGPKCYFISKKVNGQPAAAVGFDFANTGFAGILKKLTGKSIAGVKMFDEGMKLGVIIAAVDFPGTTFDGPTLTQLGEVKKGLTLAGVFKLPACGNDPICKFLEPVLGGSSLQLKASIASLNEFTVSAGLSNIKLGSAMTIQSAGLELAISTTSAPSVGIVCELLVHSPPLLFKGSLSAIPTGELESKMLMEGLWTQAFGIPWLTVGNLLFSIKFVPGVSPTAFEIGGEVHIGSPGKQLKGATYVGVDTTDPKKNYFYGSINKVTIYSVMNAFGIRISLPKPLREMGFVNGLEVSYSVAEKRVPGRVIPAGMKLKGEVNFLGFRANADIHVNPGKFLKIDLEMSPFNLAGGLFKMYAHRSMKSRGPFMKADISLSPPKVLVHASGYVELFGSVSLGATLLINETKYIMEINTIYFLFPAYLRVHASYGSLASASFAVYGELSAQWLQDLVNKVTGIIKSSADEATRKISEVQGKIDKARKTLSGAQEKFRSAQNKVNGLCRIKSCGTNCVGCPKWNSCWKRVWGRCIGRPGWNSCCTRISNPICVAANVACKALRGVAYGALWVAEKALNAAKIPFYAATAALEVAKKAVKLGAEAATWLASNVLTGLIRIRKIYFDVAIHSVKGGHFGGGIEVSFLKRAYTKFGFSLRLGSPLEMAKDLADRMWNGISGRRGRDVEASLKAAFPGYAERLVDPYSPGSYASKVKRVKKDLFDESEFELSLTDAPPTVSIPFDLDGDDVDDDEDHESDEEREVREGLENLIKDEEKARPHIEVGEKMFDSEKISFIDSTPETDADRCVFFNQRFDFLSNVVSALESVYEGLSQEVRPYSSQKSKMGKCSFMDDAERQGKEIEQDMKDREADLKKNEEESDEILGEIDPSQQRKTREANRVSSAEVERVVQVKIKNMNNDLKRAQRLCDDVDKFQQNSHDILVDQNSRGLRNVFDEIDNATVATFQKPFKAFIDKLCDSLYEMYDGYAEKEGAEKVRDLVARVCNHFGYDGGEDIGDQTVLKSHSTVMAIRKQLEEMKGIPVFCHD